MKQNRVISTAVLFLFLGTTIPAFAQKGQEEKGGGGAKAQPAQHQAQPQRAQKAQPQRAQQAQRQAQPQRQQPQRAQQAQRQAQPQRQQPQRAQQAQHQQRPQAVANNRGGGHYGRISDAGYRSHFGRGHSFHMMRPQMIGGYNRFQYGGYWFGYNQAWPVGWDYNDDCYVEYIDGVYYMFNLRHPGFRLTLNIF
jgi:hypothetical protein